MYFMLYFVKLAFILAGLSLEIRPGTGIVNGRRDTWEEKNVTLIRIN